MAERRTSENDWCELRRPVYGADSPGPPGVMVLDVRGLLGALHVADARYLVVADTRRGPARRATEPATSRSSASLRRRARRRFPPSGGRAHAFRRQSVG